MCDNAPQLTSQSALTSSSSITLLSTLYALIWWTWQHCIRLSLSLFINISFEYIHVYISYFFLLLSFLLLLVIYYLFPPSIYLYLLYFSILWYLSILLPHLEIDIILPSLFSSVMTLEEQTKHPSTHTYNTCMFYSHYLYILLYYYFLFLFPHYLCSMQRTFAIYKAYL